MTVVLKISSSLFVVGVFILFLYHCFLACTGIPGVGYVWSLVLITYIIIINFVINNSHYY